MKELKRIHDDLMDFFGIDGVGYMGDKLWEIAFDKNKDTIYDAYKEIVGDIETDWIQKLYQYYGSNREDFKQDYTPQSLAKCLAKMLYWKGAKMVYDACSGSGSLVIELHKIDKDLEFVCEEFDNNVIPFLLFNLSIRNISAVVIRGDIVKQEQYDFYKLTPGEKYSEIEKIDKYNMGHFDIITSNPPFNLKNFKTNRVFDADISISNSSNAYFLLHCLDLLSDDGRLGIILPTGFVTSQKKDDMAIRKYLVMEDLLEAAISCPGHFFESTPVNTSILFINKMKEHSEFVLIDNTTENCSEWIREQRGQFGGNSHTKRVYKKKFNVFSDENIEKILSTIRKKEECSNYSVVLSCLKFNDSYSFNAGYYFPVVIERINITQEQYDRMIDEFFKGFESFLDGIKTFQEQIKMLL